MQLSAGHDGVGVPQLVALQGADQAAVALEQVDARPGVAVFPVHVGRVGRDHKAAGGPPDVVGVRQAELCSVDEDALQLPRVGMFWPGKLEHLQHMPQLVSNRIGCSDPLALEELLSTDFAIM